MFTTWIERPNSRLNDYAHHQLSGMLSGYYAQRWKIFFADPENAEAKLDELERNALSADWKTPPKGGNLLEIAKAIVE
jgi:hypothetical protein